MAAARPLKKQPRRGTRRSKKQRQAALEAAAFKEMLREHWAIPAVGLAVILVFGATKFEESRAVLAQVAAVALPCIALGAAAYPLRETHPTLRTLAFGASAVLALGAELRLVPAVLPGPFAAGVATLLDLGRSPVVTGLLVAAALVTVPVEALAARRGTGSRLATVAGATVVLALYLPTHRLPADPFGTVLASLVVGLLAGGGSGLLLGVLARSAAGARP